MKITYIKILFIILMELVILTLFFQLNFFSLHLIAGTITFIFGSILFYFIIMRSSDDFWERINNNLYAKIAIGGFLLVYGFTMVGLYNLIVLIFSV